MVNKTEYVQAPAVVVAPPLFGSNYVATAPVFVESAPPSLGDVAVSVGAAMAIKAVADVISPSPEKVMQNQLREDERMLDKQQEQIRQLQNQLIDLKTSK